MPVATNNYFAVLDVSVSHADDEPATKEGVTDASQPPLPATRAPKGRKHPRGGERPSTSDSPPATASKPVGAETKRSEYTQRGGRARGSARGGRRPFDKHSQTGKTDSDKKIHQAWGGDDGTRELRTERDAIVDATAESIEWDSGATAAADSWNSPAGEVTTTTAPSMDAVKEETQTVKLNEEGTMTLEEYRAQQPESSIPKVLNIRQANEGADSSIWIDAVEKLAKSDDAYFVGKPKNAPKPRAKKEEKTYIEIAASFERPNRGGRGFRGGDRGFRGGDRVPRGGDRGRNTRGRGTVRGHSEVAAVDVTDKAAFPSLS